jgi:SAM-dependent methyltransferase
MSDVSDKMRADWNARAKEDAGYYVAFGRRDQTDEEFFATAVDTVGGIEYELRRLPLDRRLRALEVGCGPGRLIRPMSRHFREIHGVDVSDEMIALARQKNASAANAHFHVGDGSGLRMFPDACMDFVYSYAVFQHIPSRDVVLSYLREMHRVMKPGAVAWLQFNGLPRLGDDEYTTWSGARFGAQELLDFTAGCDFQVLALDGVATQYMWTTWRKQPTGWRRLLESKTPGETLRIRRITNANSSEPVAPSRGRFASISIWVEGLDPDASMHDLRVRVGDSCGTVTYIGVPDSAGLQQINVLLPVLEATGLLPVEILWLGQRIAPPASLRVIPPGPSVPRLTSVTDGVNLVAGTRIETRTVKVTLEEIAHPDEIDVMVAGLPVGNLEYFCVDPRPQKYEINFRLPDGCGLGTQWLHVRIGRRRLAPLALEVVG